MFNFTIFTIPQSLRQKIWLWLLSCTVLFLGFVWWVHAQTTAFPYDNVDIDNPTVSLEQDFKENLQADESLRDRLVTLLWFPASNTTIRWTGETEWQTATNYIRYIINVALALTAFIALIMLLYGFGMMFFSEKEEWLKRAQNIIKGTIIALVVMALSWFVVSMIIYFYETVNDVTIVEWW